MMEHSMIRQLCKDDASELVRVIESNPKIQVHSDSEHRRWFVHDYLVPHLAEKDRVLTLGYFDNGYLRAFVETRRWTDNDRHVTLGTTSVDQTVYHASARGSRWPQAIIALVNAVVGIHRGLGRDIVWTTRPDDPRWVPLTSAPDCVLRGYQSEVAYKAKANELYPPEFSQVSIRMPSDQLVIKMVPRGELL